MHGLPISASAAALLLCGASVLSPLIRAQSPTLIAQAVAPITLDAAIHLAEGNEPALAAASAERRILALERKNARAALLPTATYHNQIIYTQPNGQSNRIGQTTNEPAPVFIANNAVREYASQGVFNETVGVTQVAAIRLADANATRATAELEIARRGLVATVVGLFYGAQMEQERIAVASRAVEQADHFLTITEQREAARESAHADVLKAQIQQQQRQREMADARLAAERARLELGILLFPEPTTTYALEPVGPMAALPDRAAVETANRTNSPELKSAFASLQTAQANTLAARGALLPELALNVSYGLDAPQFARNGPDNVRNVGYSASATLDIPVWDWLTSERKIKEGNILQAAAKTSLDAAQRRRRADLAEFYAEAVTAQSQLASLDRTVQAAGESLRLTNLRYVDGEGTVLEVVDAQSTLISAENARLDGRIRYQVALGQLQTLTGNL